MWFSVPAGAGRGTLPAKIKILEKFLRRKT
jgi:hypothetical protein